MSTCHRYPTKAKAIEGFCDDFPGFCSVSATGVESVPSDVEKSILFDTDTTNDKNDCDGGFDSSLTCPSACGQPRTRKSATYKVVADAFGEGAKECPYHDGFVMNMSCPATPACPADCSGGTWNYTCPTNCGYGGGNVTATLTGYTPAVGTGSCTTTKSVSCPATDPCPADCSGGTWNYTCPTNCGYGGGTVTATRTGYTPAVGTGSCTTTRSQPCPAQPSCPEPDFVDVIFTPIDVITTPVSSCTIM
jgi:hypothetical protein